MMEAYEVTPDVFVLPSFVDLGQLGTLPLNAFLVKGRSPYLVDTGLILDHEPFMGLIEELIDPRDLELIYLTHTDPDHIGSLQTLTTMAPNATIVTSFIGLKKLELMGIPLPGRRVHLLNPGEQLSLDGHRLTVGSPAVFDAPETTVLYDSDLDVLFSADSFGAPLRELTETANDVPGEELLQGQTLWASLDSPWLHNIDRERFAKILTQFERMDPEWILSAHLPPARRMVRKLCANLAKAPDVAPFVGPNHEQFQAMLNAAMVQPTAP